MKYSFSILALLLFVAGCGNGEQAQSESSEAPANATAVYVQELAPQTFNHYLNIQGTVESDKTILISPKTSATVEQIHVSTGDNVKQGDVLASLDGEITKSQLEQVKSQLKLARTTYERQKKLRQQDIGSEIEFLQAETQVESLESQLNTLTEQYNNYTIRATIGGTVNSVMLKEGEFVGPSAPVFQIANSEALKVTAEISEAYITKIEKTDNVSITFPSIDTTYTKTLDVVSKVIDPSNRTFAVEVYIPNFGGLVRPNMMAKLKINDYSKENQMVVPVNAVQQGNQINYVFVAEQDGSSWIAKQREVKPGESYGNKMVIQSGLNAGDRLITTGYNELADGDPISIKEN